MFFTILLPLVEIIGIGGNVAFITMVIRVPYMRTTTNGYLVNIALADLLFIGYGCTLYVVTYFLSPMRNDVPFTTWIGCVVVWWPTYLTYFASMTLLTMATLEKYYGICHPFKHRSVTGKGRTIRIITLSWFLGSVLSGLVTLRYAGLQTQCILYPDDEQYVNFPKRIQLCVSLSKSVLVFSEAVTVVPFFIALAANIYMYARIIHALSHRNVTNELEDSIQKMRRQVRNQVARILIINGVIFFCCQFPYRLLSINLFVQEARGEDLGFLSLSQYGALAVSARCLVLVNSCANPFVYFLTSSNYREGFRRAYCCCIMKRSTEPWSLAQCGKNTSNTNL